MENKNLILNDGGVEALNSNDASENNYLSEISEAFGYSKEYMDAMQRNYPDMTRAEIIEKIEGQKDYDIRFYHQHEGISGDLIKKYLILDDVDTYTEKITLETPESHDCNLVELTPDLQDKAYRGHRGSRDIASHLIDRKDYPWENKTNKLTIIGKRKHCSYYDEDLEEQVEYEYFYVITAFWGDGSAKREPKDDEYGYSFDQMKYWMNHALIPETDEPIERRDRPSRVDEYHKIIEEKKVAELKYLSIREMYRQLINCIKSESGKFDKIEDITMRKCFDMNDEEIDIDINKWCRFNKLYFIVHDGNKFRVIEASIPYIMLSKDEYEYEDDGTPQIVLNKDMTESDILDIDFTKNFKINVIKDVDNDKEMEDDQLIKYRKNFIKRYYKEKNFEKIINATGLFDCKRETDSEGSKITTIKVGNNIYKLMESNLSNHSDDKYKSVVRSCCENISDFIRCEVDLDGMRGDNPDEWNNKKLSDYIKEKKSLGFEIPSYGEFNELLKNLGGIAGLENFRDQLLLLMYLTGLDGGYWLSMDGKYRDRLKLQNLMLWSNIGSVDSAILLLKKEI